MGWLPVFILSRQEFPKIEPKGQRAITWDEQCRIVTRDRKNGESAPG